MIECNYCGKLLERDDNAVCEECSSIICEVCGERIREGVCRDCATFVCISCGSLLEPDSEIYCSRCR